MIEPLTNRFSVETNEVLWSRTYFLTLGFISMAGLINFDINKYKFWKGIMRWKHRVEGFFGMHHHGHEHGLIGDFPGAHHGHDDHGHHGDSHRHGHSSDDGKTADHVESHKSHDDHKH